MKAYLAVFALFPLLANSASLGQPEGIVSRGVCPEVTTVTDLDFERVSNLLSKWAIYDQLVFVP